MDVAKKKKKKVNVTKYYYQRYRLFSRYDDGIQMDDEAWWSVTPENIATHIAQRFLSALGDGHLVIVDGFCGVGGNLIQFARMSPHVRVIGCDIDLARLKMAKNNARIYGVMHQCEFIHGDFLQLITALKAKKVDAVFLSPPWGGTQYMDIENYSLDLMQPNGFEVVQLCRRHLSKNIAFLMPRNVDMAEVRKRLLDKQNRELECEQNLVGAKIKTITVYFGDLVDLDVESDEGVGGVSGSSSSGGGGGGGGGGDDDSLDRRPAKRKNFGVTSGY